MMKAAWRIYKVREPSSGALIYDAQHGEPVHVSQRGSKSATIREALAEGALAPGRYCLVPFDPNMADAITFFDVVRDAPDPPPLRVVGL